MKSKNKILLHFLVLIFLVLGTSCRIFHPHQKPNRGELMTSMPHGRLEWGEMDKMSGRNNILPEKREVRSDKKKSGSVSQPDKSKSASKKEKKKYNDQYGHWQTKKSKRKRR